MKFFSGTMIFLVFVFIVSNFVTAQSQNHSIDSLLRVPGKKLNDSSRARTLINIGDQYRLSNFDSALNYYENALDLGRILHNRSLQLEANKEIADLCMRTGNLPGALQLSLDNLKILEETH